MEETSNKSGMSAGMIIGIAVVVAIVFGGGAYAYVNNKAEKEKKDLNAQITELQSQVTSSGSTTTTTPSFATDTAEKSNTIVTYTHPELKYSLTLPVGFVGVDKYNCEGTCTSNLTLASKVADGSYSDSNVSLQYYKSSNSLEKEASDYRAKNESDILEETDVKINGVAAKKFKVGGMSDGYDYLAVSNGFNLTITQYPSNAKNQKIVDLIVATFQFTK